MVKNNHLQKQSEARLSLIQVSKTSDLLKANTISSQIQNHGIEIVQNHISLSLVKCAFALNIQLSQAESQVIIEDLTDKYPFESIEDIQQCLKKGRQGNYGPIFGKLNMIVISGWMAKHLEEKAIAREVKLSKEKSIDGPQFKSIKDYHKWVKQGLENQKELADKKEELRQKRNQEKLNTVKIEMEHPEFKKNYEATKTNWHEEDKKA